MVDIIHRIGLNGASPEKVHEALTTISGLAGWWTLDTKGSAELGRVIEFRFLPGGIDMKVAELKAAERVGWEVADGPPEWTGTTVNFDIRQAGDFTIVLFSHVGWKEAGEFMAHCSTKWAIFLMSLKSLVETGTGQPAPRDTQISDWH